MRIRGIKGKLEERKKDFWTFGDPEKKKGEETREKERKERGR